MGFTDSGYTRGDFIRVCDICGHRYHFSQLRPIGELRYACPDDSPGLTAMQISRWNARARPLKIRPNRWAKGITQTPTYQIPEAATFNFIASVAPATIRDFVPSALAGAWAAIYMADIVNQGLRPAGWIATAKASLRTCLNFVLTQQYGAPTGISPAGASSDPRYGGIKLGVNYSTATTIAAGVAFVMGASALGDWSLLAAADRCATSRRHAQCGDLQVSTWTTYPSGGGPYHIGGLASGVVDSTQLQTTSYLTADIAALWFLSLLVAARSPSTVYGDGAATAFFSASTAAPLSQMISELAAFAATGARDSTAAGAFVTGLSTTAPRATYVAATNGGSGTATWTPISTIARDSIAMATLGVFEAFGLNAQVTAIMSWLASFTPNHANATPAQADSKTLAGITGTYDPTLCPADNLTTSAPFTEAAGALYSWSSLGLLSPILAQQTPGLRTSKDQLDAPERVNATEYSFRYLGPIGLSGLNLQPGTTADNVLLAAKGGMIWRQPPGYYPQVALF
jgi:hypothetical protein